VTLHGRLRASAAAAARFVFAAGSLAGSLAGFLAILLAAGRAEARVVEKIAAVVGEAVVLASEVEEKAAPMMTDVTRLPDPDKRAARAATLRHEVLDRLIDDELILQQAAELKLSITSEQIDASIEEIKKQNSIDDDQLREALKGQGMTMGSYRADLKRQLLRFRVLNVAVGSRVNISDDEVKAYYERHMKDMANVQVRASHVFIAIPPGSDATAVSEKQAQAQKILERAKAGEDFAKLAREVSDDAATRADGGDLGYFGKDMLPKAIEELVFAMKPGEVRGPVRADRGFHVIKLVDRKTKDPKPLDEVKDDIRMQLRQKDMERQTKIYLAELRKKTLVDIRY
jgi:peptidyl-prolyl cis-trans isomerase SurA